MNDLLSLYRERGYLLVSQIPSHLTGYREIELELPLRSPDFTSSQDPRRPLTRAKITLTRQTFERPDGSRFVIYAEQGFDPARLSGES